MSGCRLDGGVLHLAAAGLQVQLPLAQLRRVLIVHKHSALPTAAADRGLAFEAGERVHLLPEVSGVAALLPALDGPEPRFYSVHYSESPLAWQVLRWNLALLRGRGGSFSAGTLRRVLARAEISGPMHWAAIAQELA